jgi:hypothetical protein
MKSPAAIRYAFKTGNAWGDCTRHLAKAGALRADAVSAVGGTPDTWHVVREARGAVREARHYSVSLSDLRAGVGGVDARKLVQVIANGLRGRLG